VSFDLRALTRMTSTSGLGYAATGLLAFALFLATWSQAADETSFCFRWYFRYISFLERKLRAMFIFSPPQLIPIGQFAAAYLLTIVVVFANVPEAAPLFVIIAAGPAVWIEKMRRERLDSIEEQLDTFILALANALKTTPSIGAALDSVIPVIDEPMRSEVDLAVKEMRVGSTLDQSLLHMAARVGSRQLDSSLSAVLIGRQVGGNLPKILETTAMTLREMRRLEGVIRTKTAEGRMQIWVIGFMPFVFMVVLNSFWPGYFDVLTKSFAGYVIIISVSGLWVSSLVTARKVLAVDF
jgi:tight adherence protein B